MPHFCELFVLSLIWGRALTGLALKLDSARTMAALYASMGMMAHFALADASGRSVAVEYIGNEMNVVDTPVVTKFYLTAALMRYAGISSFSSALTAGNTLFPAAAVVLCFAAFAWIASGRIKRIELAELVTEQTGLTPRPAGREKLCFSPKVYSFFRLGVSQMCQ